MTEQTAPLEVRLDWAERLSDRCSPILVREVQQALSGRAFLGTLATTVVAIVLLALTFSWAGDGDPQRGREAFAWCIACLTPIVLLIVPLQSFASMRQEMSGGTAEHLLMTRLRPSRIVLGKALAGFAQFVLFLGVFAPLMALTFVLQGVDALTIAITLGFAVLSSVAANMFAIGMAAVGGARPVQLTMLLLTLAGLAFATVGVWAGAYDIPREIAAILRDSQSWLILSSFVGSYVIGTWLFAMVATACLAHAYENRSSQFRAFAFGVLVLLAVWVLTVIDVRFLDDAPGFASASFALCLAPFWLWAACEEPQLSPRVRSLVPRSRALALLSAPFLPGGQRGLLLGVVLAATGVAIGLGLPWIVGVNPDREAVAACVLAWLYVPIFGLLARTIRSRLSSGRRGSVLAFVATLLAVFVLSILPLVVHLLLDEPVRQWHIGHVFNPFFTVVDGARRNSDAPLVLGVLAAIALVLSVPSIARGITEVMAASRARVRRASAD